MTRKVLVLFPDEWDRAAVRDPALAARHAFEFEGFDLFRFPENARLFCFDPLAFAERVARRHAGTGIEAVVTGVAGAVIASLGILAGKFLFIDDLLSGIVSNGVVPPIEVADVLWVSPILLMIGAGVAAVTGYVTLRLYVRL